MKKTTLKSAVCFCGMLLGGVFSCSPLLAKQERQVYDAWHYFPFDAKQSCSSAQSAPIKPDGCKDSVRLVISQFKDSTGAEISFTNQEDLSQKSPPVIKVGDKTFVFKVIDGKMAWPNESDEKELLNALKSASEADLNVTTADNKKTTYRFSLKGFSKALGALTISQNNEKNDQKNTKKNSSTSLKNTISKEKKA